jgi:hypothetical protein
MTAAHPFPPQEPTVAELRTMLQLAHTECRVLREEGAILRRAVEYARALAMLESDAGSVRWCRALINLETALRLTE